MRIKYSGFLLSDATAQLKRIPLPEPPSDEEMRLDLAGIERLEEALELWLDDNYYRDPEGANGGNRRQEP